MTTLFVSDLHLHESRPEVTDSFIEFLGGEARHAECLYILGDLFEAWIGDDDPDSHNRRVINALRDFTAAGSPCYLMHGNRDFLIGKRFAAETGVLLLGETETVAINGERTLLMHGDQLCTDDHQYQRLRRRVRNPILQAVFLALPITLRRTIRDRLRRQSVADSGIKPEAITDVNQTAVEDALRHNGVLTLLHGHTHRPAIHRFSLDGRQAARIVLGDWYDQGSMLRWDAGGYRLRTIEYGEAATSGD